MSDRTYLSVSSSASDAIAKSPATFEVEDVGNGTTRLFREHVPSGQKLQLQTAGVISDSLSSVNGLKAKMVGSSAGEQHSTTEKWVQGDPLAEISGEDTIDFVLENETGNIQNSVSARWTYEYV